VSVATKRVASKTVTAGVELGGTKIQTEPERERHEQEVIDRRQRELEAGQVDRGRGEGAHATAW
jgi:hypothetical protein